MDAHNSTHDEEFQTVIQEKATNEIIKKYTAKGYYVTSLTDKEIILYKNNQ